MKTGVNRIELENGTVEEEHATVTNSQNSDRQVTRLHLHTRIRQVHPHAWHHNETGKEEAEEQGNDQQVEHWNHIKTDGWPLKLRHQAKRLGVAATYFTLTIVFLGSHMITPRLRAWILRHLIAYLKTRECRAPPIQNRALRHARDQKESGRPTSPLLKSLNPMPK